MSENMDLFSQFKDGSTGTSPGEHLFNIPTVTSESLQEYPDGINQVYRREIDGFLIKGALTPQEVGLLTTNLSQLPAKQRAEINEEFNTYPPSFAQVDQSSNNSREILKDYFRQCTDFRDSFAAEFDVDFEERIKSIFSLISGGRKIDTSKGVDNVGIFTPFNFRELSPGSVQIKAHCGNFFHKEFPHFFTSLEEQSSVKDQLSYFVLLQAAEIGGELTLYEIEWKDAEARLENNTILVGKDGSKSYLEDESDVSRMYVNPEPGDMIIFAGGQIWHRVEPVQGNTNRITLGGFLTFSHDDSTIYFWA